MNDDEPDKLPEERIADALERQTRLMEDRNAILKDGIETILWALYDKEGRESPDGRAPSLEVEDGLFDLNYINTWGRTDRRPDQERR